MSSNSLLCDPLVSKLKNSSIAFNMDIEIGTSCSTSCSADMISLNDGKEYVIVDTSFSQSSIPSLWRVSFTIIFAVLADAILFFSYANHFRGNKL